MLQGYWAKEWQHSFVRTYLPPDEETPADKSKRQIKMGRWQASVIRITWTGMIALWKIRRDERHGRDADTREAARHEVLTNELKVLYSNRDQYPPAVQRLLRSSYDIHSRDKSARIEDWLNAFRVTFQVTHIRPNG